ncbi:GNAT family N-acetyltransferase [Telmatocola sphagniphila]|uniref:GNAT family N-acetyltransferase n=1 Tax=Telmatocola sphagniphila TaxID=1123043 RepID=A0A8E6BAP2_9BACT|nr:GNAT family N-acetyltransferase [Telmatocola sphagniphila]QVL33500.1 GNAT family N-acetyltransferase [Telmatocola sphagniphila]
MIEFELQPHLIGNLIELRPLVPEDWDKLFAVASDPKIWEVHPAFDRYQEPVFRKFFEDAIKSRGALVALDRKSGEVIGSSRYAILDLDKREIEIGWSFLARAYWGGSYNGEMKKLMLQHAFPFFERVLFMVGENNIRSRKALEKIGAVLTQRSDTRQMAGKMVTHVIYQIEKSAYLKQ